MHLQKSLSTRKNGAFIGTPRMNTLKEIFQLMKKKLKISFKKDEDFREIMKTEEYNAFTTKSGIWPQKLEEK